MRWLGGVVAAMVACFCAVSQASAETRTLKLYFIHTKERAEITFKRNGRYDQKGIDQINRFLRDWRRNEPARMDPKLLDLLWEVYRGVGARDYINVVSAYRSPATNNMLRNRSSGVAKNSQHTMGKAIDFFIPGVPLSKLRAAGFKAEGGGVGYYPKSGSPFVHLDVGNVRAWPRMSRSELMALFPDGRTIHVPADGKPLPGYKQAMAAYESRRRSGGTVQIAGLSSGSRSGSAARASAASATEGANAGSNSGGGGGLLAALFRGGQNNSSEAAPAQARPAAAPAQPAARQAPQPPAAVPVPVAEPDPQTPEAIIAALPARAVPLPIAAPRPLVDIGARPAAPLVAGLPAQPQPAAAAEPQQPEAEAEVAVAVPVPTRRPDYAPAAAPAGQVVAAAAGTSVGGLPVAAIVPEPAKRSGSDAILEMLATSAAEARADVIVNPPVPALRPRLRAEDVQPRRDAPSNQVAAASPQSGGDVFVLASLPTTGISPAPRPQVAPAASPRVAMIGREPGAAAAAVLDSGVRTTAKGSKPRAHQARPDPRPVAVPVQHELTRWVFKREVTVSTAGGSTEPAIAHDIVRSAPSAVYTTGFQQADVSSVANRFTGTAVTFIPVARFTTN